MRIAQIAPLTESIPPKLYGGTERVVSWLTEELVAMGHDVTLFASGDSQTGAELEAMWPTALRFDQTVRDPVALHMLMLERVYRRAGKFDVLHFHLDYFPFSLFQCQTTPFVTTLHGRLDLPEHQPLFAAFPSFPVIGISDAQMKYVPHAGWAGRVYHGLPETLLTPQQAVTGYLAFLGRIAPEKRVDLAIHIAIKSGMKLKIAAKIDRVDREYFETEIRALMDHPNIEYLGEIADSQKSEFLSGAQALLVPIDWPEPFGLVMIESFACGTPVIAFDRGSVSEIVDDGVTGFIVNDVPAAVEAVGRLPQLSRTAIRQRFEERFTARRMAQDYLDVYAEIMDGVVHARRSIHA